MPIAVGGALQAASSGNHLHNHCNTESPLHPHIPRAIQLPPDLNDQLSAGMPPLPHSHQTAAGQLRPRNSDRLREGCCSKRFAADTLQFNRSIVDYLYRATDIVVEGQ